MTTGGEEVPALKEPQVIMECTLSTSGNSSHETPGDEEPQVIMECTLSTFDNSSPQTPGGEELSKEPQALVEYTPSTSCDSPQPTPEPQTPETIGYSSTHSVHSNINYSETSGSPGQQCSTSEYATPGNSHCYAPVASPTCYENVEPLQNRSHGSRSPQPGPSKLSSSGHSLDIPIDISSDEEEGFYLGLAILRKKEETRMPTEQLDVDFPSSK